MRIHKVIWIPLAIAVAGFCVLWSLRPSPANSRSGERTVTITPGKPLDNGKSVATDPLGGAFDQLKASPDSLQSLKELQEKLAKMNPADAVAWIRDFLKSGKDKDTGLTFEIESDHTIKQWPTFRTFLIDALRKIDPAAAAEVSRGILSKPTTADEWALALRNVGLADQSAETNTTLREKTEALINNPGWQANPSIGYLNAFDVLVHTKAVDSTPLLSDLIQRKDRKDLVHAAFLTLDRLVQREPADVLSRLAADKALQQSRPEMSAQQFARADVRDPEQQAIVKTWMLDPARTGTELNSFAGVYPNNNHFVSNNLLTTEPNQSGADLATHDRQALEILNTWAADPAFAPVKDHLATMIARLNGFVANPNQ